MSCDEKNEPLQILSLGAGVQSSTLALMAAHGEIGPMPDCAIFADVQAEPRAVYDYLDWLEGVLPFPVHRITGGSLTAHALTMREKPTGEKWLPTMIPAHTVTVDGERGLAPRQCTREFKIRPIAREVKRIAGIKRGEKAIKVIQWIGISLDEVARMKPSRDAWQENRWPLVERRINRHDCKQWMKRNGYPEPPRSACVYCPFKSNAEWRHLRDTDANGWAEACRVDGEYRRLKHASGQTTGFYVHSQGVPLADADLTTDADHGQLDMFQNECEGMCGV